MAGSLHIRGAAQNNLQSLDLDIPLNRITVITGPSGAGKSSLAFETLYAEGQRLYSETFSTYARQFLERLPRPTVERIENIPPALSVSHQSQVRTGRVTVLDLVEGTFALQNLFARLGYRVCDSCGARVDAVGMEDMVDGLLERHPGRDAVIAFRVSVSEKDRLAGLIQDLVTAGFARGLSSEGQAVRLEEVAKDQGHPVVRQWLEAGQVTVAIDRIRIGPDRRDRISEGVQTALSASDAVWVLVDGHMEGPLRKGRHCRHCDLTYPQPTPYMFSADSPVGACPRCGGYGYILELDPDRAIPDQSLSVAQGAVHPFQHKVFRDWQADLVKACRRRGLDTKQPVRDLAPEDLDFILYGGARWRGVASLLDFLEEFRHDTRARIFASKYRRRRLCPDCLGARIGPEGRAWRIGGQGTSLLDFVSMTAEQASTWLARLHVPDEAGRSLRNDLQRRMQALMDLGLGHLTLNRLGLTLSGGELSRVHLARGLGTGMSGALYVLEEPSTGLHPRDIQGLMVVLRKLRDLGNTVVVTDHDPILVKNADHVVELGPSGGSQGGRLLFQGPPENMASNPESVTAPFLTPSADILAKGHPAKTRPGAKSPVRRPAGPVLSIRGARANNLQNLDMEIPVGRFTTVTGLSGSGKSTLLQLVHEATTRALAGLPLPSHGIRALSGMERFKQVVFADQSPPARSSRSNAATFTKAFDPIRRALAKTDQAKRLGLDASWFSFNSTKGGACPRCKGSGVEVVEMQFLPDQEVPCPACGGTRYQALALEVTYRGFDIAQILDLTVDQAADFFSDITAVVRRLHVLQRVGLGHLTLGQRFTTLSAGEAQRLKLARLLQGSQEGLLLILDEPSMGLHPLDTDRIVSLFSSLTRQGATILAADHEMRLVARSDWILELGPGSGPTGGLLTAAGPPGHMVTRIETATGKALAEFVGQTARPTRTGREAGTEVEEQGLLMAAEQGPAYRATPSPKGDSETIFVRGASEHNLQDVEVSLPRGRMVCITGVSGSGKSTLAFDVLFSEGRRRYLESQQAYVRKFLRPMPRPHVEHISGLPPTVAVSRKASSGGRRSTVGTVTEVSHYLRLLFAKFGTQVCPDCGLPTEPATEGRIHTRLQELASQGEIIVLAPLLRSRKGHHAPLITKLARNGIQHILVDGKLVGTRPLPKLARYKTHDMDAVVGLVGPDQDPAELRDIADLALDLGNGTLLVLEARAAKDRAGKEAGSPPLVLSRKRTCPSCHRSFEEPDPLLLSFNSPSGACPICDGLGILADSQYDRYETAPTCPACKGSRLRPQALAIQVAGRDIAEVSGWTMEQALEEIPLLADRDENVKNSEVAQRLIGDIHQRLRAAVRLGLGYLTLDRAAPTLSTGESQRLRLAAQLGSELRGAAYVLDEPTVGLHPSDTNRLVSALEDLTKRGSSVLVVEHEESVIRAADHILDMGPGAGSQGGRVVYSGPLSGIALASESITGRELAKRDQARNEPAPGKQTARNDARIKPRRPRRSCRPKGPLVTLQGARLHNLRDLDVSFRQGAVNLVTGVSGSGKTSLVLGVLGPAVTAKLARRTLARDLADQVDWDEPISAVRIVDQAPIGRTPRSIPATYVGLFDRIRKLFAALPEARLRGLGPSHFSFNSPKGSCPVCKGQGRIKVEMRFLPDVMVPCETCGGSRYRPEILRVEYHGLDLAEILDLTIAEARELFSSVPSIHRQLALLDDLGLGYLTLGQPSPTLSGGEAQRIRLAAELHKPSSGALYLLDEPTTGLHMADVDRLVAALKLLAARGNTVVVVEHNLDLIAQADWVLDLGPGPGRNGGRIVAQGPPAEVARTDTATGRCLAGVVPAAGDAPSHGPLEPDGLRKNEKTGKNRRKRRGR